MVGVFEPPDSVNRHIEHLGKLLLGQAHVGTKNLDMGIGGLIRFHSSGLVTISAILRARVVV